MWFAMKLVVKKLTALFAALSLLWVGSSFADDPFPARFTNIGGITNSRHNLSQVPIGSREQRGLGGLPDLP